MNFFINNFKKKKNYYKIPSKIKMNDMKTKIKASKEFNSKKINAFYIL